jgi:tetratricopeptide (TPR) repeat protein
MQRSAFRLVLAALIAAALALATAASAQTSPQRIVFFPFETSDSVEAFGLAFPAALQRALNEIDGVYVPPVGDAGVALQRLLAGGTEDALPILSEAFGADALVLGRVIGSDAVALELVVLVDGEERTARIEGRVNDLPALWRAAADRVIATVELTPSVADVAAVRAVLGDAPSLPSLVPVGAAAARLPNARLDQLDAAASLDEGSAWVRSELARAAALAGQTERATAAAAYATATLPAAEHAAIEGVVRLVAGDEEGARTAFEAALARNPAHAVALVGLAQTTADPATRAELLARAIDASPRLVEAQVGLAGLQSTPAAAVQALRRASERLPDSPSVLTALVDATLAAGDPRGALDLLRSAAARPLGRTPTAYGVAGRLPDAVLEDALTFVREGTERFPDALDLRRLEADLLRRSGDDAAAVAVLRQIVEAQPRSLEDVTALATLLAARGEGDEAQALLAGVADLDPDADVRAAEVDLAAGRARSALATLEPAITAGAEDVARRTLYGIALGRVGRVDEAQATLRAVLEDAPDAALAARALALLEEQGRIADGADLALEGEAATAFEQGLGALETAEYVRAADAFARARTFGDAGLLAFYEGYARQRAGDPRGAIAAYEAARADLEGNDVVLNNLGYAHLQVGRLDRALDVLRAAVEANPENARAHLNLGLAQYGSNRFSEAVASFDRALALDPTLEESAAGTIEDARARAAR